jgi:hypothetical protein
MTKTPSERVPVNKLTGIDFGIIIKLKEKSEKIL